MPARKRRHEEISMKEDVPPAVSDDLRRLRNMWEFAGINQYLFMFGKAVKIEDIDIEDFEQELLKPTPSERLAKIGLQLLKQISSHKGLTQEIFDEYARRQYQAKAERRNPFGTSEAPNKFDEFDIFTKVRVLYQLSTWTLHNPNTIREKMAETDETTWRVEPYGWDRDDRQYYVFDDDRLYRREEPAIPPPPRAKPKAKSKKGRNTRSKRQRISRTVPDTSPDDSVDVDMSELTEQGDTTVLEADDGTDGGYTWELIAITLEEYNAFLDTIRKSKDPNEKILVKRILENVIPHLHTRAEQQEKEAARRARELQVMQKMATAKRSSRLADKQENAKAAQEEAEAERKRQADLRMAHKEQQKQNKMLEERQSRMMTREQRIKEREVKRILHEEKLAQEQEQLEKFGADGELDDGSDRPRISERQLKADVQKRQQQLAELQEEDDEWVFDCAGCGLHGQNIDDGTHSIACEKCNVWQHSACHGVSQEEAESDDFHFVCQDCKDRLANPIPPMKLKFGSSPRPEALPTNGAIPDEVKPGTNGVAEVSLSDDITTHQQQQSNDQPLVPVQLSSTPAPSLPPPSQSAESTAPNIPVLPRPKSPQAPLAPPPTSVINGIAATMPQSSTYANGYSPDLPAVPNTPASRPSTQVKRENSYQQLQQAPAQAQTPFDRPAQRIASSPVAAPYMLTPHQSISARSVSGPHQTPSQNHPVPAFTTPGTGANMGASATNFSLLGSSPGFSPAKKSSPPPAAKGLPPPAVPTANGSSANYPSLGASSSFRISSQGSQLGSSQLGSSQGVMPPVTLSPRQTQQVMTPPVKNASPPRSMSHE